jgi:MoxR-like ATPase
MGKERIRIGDKLVWPSERYRPVRDLVTDFIGRDGQMRLVTAAWMAGRRDPPLAPLLVGEPGVGKNRLVYELAYRTGRELYIFQGHEDVSAEDLACAVRFSDSADNKMDYVISPLVTAMHRGGICFIDEIGKIRPRALALLVSVLDERRYVDSSLLAERVYAHPRFRFIAATNTCEINALPEFIRSRMRPVVQIGYPPRLEIDQIVARHFPGSQEHLKELADVFWVLWEQHAKDGKPPTPRDAIHLFALATSFSDVDALNGDVRSGSCDESSPLPLESRAEAPDLKPAHLEHAFQELFRQNDESV